ncbi:glycosyltransferase [Geobacter argillaceus]|uniref:ADP-heptose:LPS heptosyltransferase n=1 Tax=Geobacter argillaceus TaxID=345631 RepID=A0A562VM06_9BACT|nr:glycosyltransferase [Geobacter argillaceus]TWJ18862.1 ADP-heptose:LPS heptosyltransferase [Geobacter argillaceus]
MSRQHGSNMGSNTLIASHNQGQLTYVKADQLFEFAIAKLKPADVVLDIGCGIRPQNYILPRIHICCEPFEQYLKVLKEKVQNDTSREYKFVSADWEKVLEIFPDKSVDTVFLVDIIEHLPKGESLKLLKDTERIARNQIAVFTTLGFIPQHHPDGKDAWGLDGGAWQEHKSGWEPEDFGADWDILVSPDFHQYDNMGKKYDVLHGAIWAIKTINPAVLFSIVVPTYNQAQYLTAALDSLITQTYSNWEALIVNDGSTDNTTQILQKYADNDSRFRLFHKPNGGVATALNEGLKHATGEWICWLSSDDLFEPDKLAVHLKAIHEYPETHFFYSHFYYLDDATGAKTEPDLWNPIPDPPFQVSRFFLGPYIHGNSIAVHRSVFSIVGLFNEARRSGQDYDMWLRISLKFPSRFINRRTCVTRWHSDQTTNAFPEAGFFDSAFSAVEFINGRSFPELFPLLDLSDARHALAAIYEAITISVNSSAIIHSCGPSTALLDRLAEWLGSPSVTSQQDTVQATICNIVEKFEGSLDLPSAIRESLIRLKHPKGFLYQWHNMMLEATRHAQELELLGNLTKAKPLRRYIQKVASSWEATLSTSADYSHHLKGDGSVEQHQGGSVLFYYAGLHNTDRPLAGTNAVMVGLAQAVASTCPDLTIHLTGDYVAHVESCGANVLLPLPPESERSAFLATYAAVIFATHIQAFQSTPKPPSQKWFLHQHCWGLEADTLTRLEDFDFVLAVSEQHRLALADHGIPVTKIVVLPNAIDTTHFCPSNRPRNEHSIMFAGAIVPHKGIHILLQAFQEVKRHVPDLELHIYGSAAMWHENDLYEKSLCELALDGVVFHGVIHNNMMPELYRQHSILCLPSQLESFGLVTIEAQACGCIPLVHNTGGVSETLIEGVTGFMYAPNTPESLSVALLKAIRVVENYPEMRIKAAEYVKQHFDISIQGRMMSNLLKQKATNRDNDRGPSELDNIIPPEIRDDEFYFLIQKMAQEEQVQNVLEIGSSAGGGSTEAFVTGLSNNKNKPKLYCMEVSMARFSELQKRYADKDFVNCYNVSSVPVSKFPSEAEVAKFYASTPTALNAYPLERVIGWLRQDIDYIKSTDVCDNGIQCIKTETGIDTFDMVLIDGSEFTGKAELDEVYGAKLILLDDINGFKNYANRQRLLADPNYRLVRENFNVRNGYSIFRKHEPSLPIHFFTIVLNGAPFIRHHIEQFLKLPFQWHWHIVEGVAELAHDTAWSLPNGGMISDELHNNGLSNDGTTAYLDQLAQSYPDKVSLYRKPAGEFWDGKLEMVSAPLANIVENCLLWQVDADELWTSQQIAAMHELFVNSPEKTAAYFHCDYFVGPRKYVSSVNTWATYPNDWVRGWRFHPGMKWAAHEPPILVGADNQDVARINPFTRDETKDLGITFQHFAYATESQVRFKEIYYGYHDAVKHWRRLQTTTGPVNPADYLPWAKHDATVDDWPLGKGELLFDQSLDAHKPKQYISMSVDAETQFETELRKLFQEISPTSIIETGTYLGRGTSTIIWRALHDLQINADFTTIEVNPEHHRQAVEYFRANGMTIKAELGLSVPKAMLPDEAKIAEQFVSNKEYESIYYDHDEAVRAKLYYSETNYNVPDNLLYKAMAQHHFKPDFVLLDSAGHIGFLEFQYFMTLIQDDCYLMLDDVFHCKHYKTLQVIKQDPRFEIVVESGEKFGFCIAKYRHIKSLVILRTDAIGDNVLASSMIPYIKEKYRNATLTLVCQDRVAPLYKECPFIENIIDYNLWQLLNNESYRSDIADNINKLNPSLLLNAVYSRDFQNYFLALSTQTTQKIACEGDSCNILPEPKVEFDKNFTCIIPNNSNDKTELDKHRSFLRGIEISAQKLNPIVWISQKDEDLAEEFFERMNLDSNSTIVVFPGALMPHKNYSHFQRVLQALQGYTLLVLGGAEVEESAEELCKNFSGRAYNLAGKTTLLQLAAIMKRARLYVGLDTSGVHIACAVGLPNVVILGGGHFGRFLPYSPLTTAVCYPLECYNCSWRCKYSRCHCVCDIRPDVVINAIKYALTRNASVPCVYVQTQSIYPDSPQSLHWSRLSNVLDLDSVEIIEG